MMKVNFFGDICLDGIDWQRFEFDPALRTLMDGGVNIGNLECTITLHGVPKPLQVRNLRAPAESLALLQGFAAVSLANNHVQDYGATGCRDTLAALGQTGIGHFGLGPDQPSALTPLILERDGVRLALLGATRYANAGNGLSGTVSERRSRLRNVIRRLKADGCFVVPYFHWGYEYVHVPPRGSVVSPMSASMPVLIWSSVPIPMSGRRARHIVVGRSITASAISSPTHGCSRVCRLCRTTRACRRGWSSASKSGRIVGMMPLFT